MTGDQELSIEQKLALGANVRLVEACPGAGKTRSIVERFKQRVDGSVGAAALLSFTNTAIDEVMSRCLDRPDLLRAPHFVGTFDTFLHRYVVTPHVAQTLGKFPTYLQSWKDLPGNLGSLPPTRETWKRISLTNFCHKSSGEISFLIDSLDRKEKQAFESLRDEVSRRRFIELGANTIRDHNNRGVYDSDSARWAALEILRGDKGPGIIARLTNRFSNIIVDEFQDCAALEHEFLGILEQAGIKVTVVADPDQSIFGFRQAEPQLYVDYRNTIPEQDIVSFSVNHRSSPVICELVQHLRHLPISTMTSAQSELSGVCPSIYLLGGSADRVRTRFISLSDDWNIPFNQRAALAYRRKDARILAAGGKNPPESNACTARLLMNLSILRSGGSSFTRLGALLDVERLLMGIFQWTSEQTRLNSAQKLELLGKDRLWVRLIVGEILTSATDWEDEGSTGESVRAILARVLTNLPVPIEGRLSNKFAKPSSEVWSHWLNSSEPRDQFSNVEWSTIHASKGREFDAVLLKIPEVDTMSSWIAGEGSEGRRVFYVGASRAKKLLALATSLERLAEVKEQLESFSLPVVAESLA